MTPISTMYRLLPSAENRASTGRLGPAVITCSFPAGPGLRLLKKGSLCLVAGSIRMTAYPAGFGSAVIGVADPTSVKNICPLKPKFALVLKSNLVTATFSGLVIHGFSTGG